MYESHSVFHFARLWGAKEGAEGLNSDNVLLGNSQNPFDELLGDVAGKIGLRYFLIEFKRERGGFKAEVSGSNAKPHRVQLYQHLRDDHDCRMLARFGHFGAYPDVAGKLHFEPYAHAIAAEQTRTAITHQALQGSKPWHELDQRSWTGGFDEFYS